MRAERLGPSTGTAGAPSSSSSPDRRPVRRAVAVVMSRFPLVTETFILREIVEMERQGQPVRLVPLLRERPRVVHPEARSWVERALYTPYLSRSIVAANLRHLRREPGRYLGLLRRLLVGRDRSLGYVSRTLALYPKAVYLAERLQREGIRHVHAHFATHPATVAFVISALTDITVSLTVHAHDIFVSREFLRQKLEAAAWVRTISRFNRRFLLDLYPSLPREKLQVIHVGVDPGLLAGAAEAPAADDSSDEKSPRLLCVAALKPYKGISVLLEACRRLRQRGVDFGCDIVGDGPLRRQLERRIAEDDLSGSVLLLGHQTQQEVARLIRRSSVVVQPSIVAPDGQMEGIPVALMEALAAAKPVVASRLSGIPELIEDGREGLLVEPGNAVALASALEGLLSNPQRAAGMGAQGPAKVMREFRLADSVATLLAGVDASNPPPDGELVEVLERLESAQTPGLPVGVRGVRRRRDSWVSDILLAGGDGPREAILKVHRTFPGESRPAALRARQEFERLDRLHDLFSRRQQGDASLPRDGEVLCGVPLPLELLSEAAALVMERCPGEPLDRLVRRGRAPWRWAGRQTLAAALRQAGVWLRRFQSVLEARQAAGACVRRLESEVVTALAEGEGRLPPGVVQSCRRRLGELLESVDRQRLEVVVRHGDYWPGNVYVGRGRLDVIDLEGLDEGLAYEDAAYFLAHLAMFLDYPFLGRHGRRLAAGFLDGYLAGDPLDRALYDLCSLAALLRILSRPAEAQRRGVLETWRRRRLLARVVAI